MNTNRDRGSSPSLFCTPPPNQTVPECGCSFEEGEDAGTCHGLEAGISPLLLRTESLTERRPSHSLKCYQSLNSGHTHSDTQTPQRGGWSYRDQDMHAKIALTGDFLTPLTDCKGSKSTIPTHPSRGRNIHTPTEPLQLSITKPKSVGFQPTHTHQSLGQLTGYATSEEEEEKEEKEEEEAEAKERKVCGTQGSKRRRNTDKPRKCSYTSAKYVASSNDKVVPSDTEPASISKKIRGIVNSKKLPEKRASSSRLGTDTVGRDSASGSPTAITRSLQSSDIPKPPLTSPRSNKKFSFDAHRVSIKHTGIAMARQLESPAADPTHLRRPKVKAGFVVDSSDEDCDNKDEEDKARKDARNDRSVRPAQSLYAIKLSSNDSSLSPVLKNAPTKQLNKSRLNKLLGRNQARDTQVKQDSQAHHTMSTSVAAPSPLGREASNSLLPMSQIQAPVKLESLYQDVNQAKAKSRTPAKADTAAISESPRPPGSQTGNNFNVSRGVTPHKTHPPQARSKITPRVPVVDNSVRAQLPPKKTISNSNGTSTTMASATKGTQALLPQSLSHNTCIDARMGVFNSPPNTISRATKSNSQADAAAYKCQPAMAATVHETHRPSAQHEVSEAHSQSAQTPNIGPRRPTAGSNSRAVASSISSAQIQVAKSWIAVDPKPTPKRKAEEIAGGPDRNVAPAKKAKEHKPDSQLIASRKEQIQAWGSLNIGPEADRVPKVRTNQKSSRAALPTRTDQLQLRAPTPQEVSASMHISTAGGSRVASQPFKLQAPPGRQKRAASSTSLPGPSMTSNFTNIAGESHKWTKLISDQSGVNPNATTPEAVPNIGASSTSSHVTPAASTQSSRTASASREESPSSSERPVHARVDEVVVLATPKPITNGIRVVKKNHPNERASTTTTGDCAVISENSSTHSSSSNEQPRKPLLASSLGISSEVIADSECSSSGNSLETKHSVSSTRPTSLENDLSEDIVINEEVEISGHDIQGLVGHDAPRTISTQTAPSSSPAPVSLDTKTRSSIADIALATGSKASSLAEITLRSSLPDLSQAAEPYFEYLVCEKRWSEEEDEEDAVETQLLLHPFTNITEANAQAQRLFESSRALHAIHPYDMLSEQSSKRDEHGCFTFSTALSAPDYPAQKSYTSIRVQRNAVSRLANRTPLELHHTVFLTSVVYILRLTKLLTPPDTSDTEDADDPQTAIRAYHPLARPEVYTTLAAANRAARSLQVELSHEKHPKSDITAKWQEKNLRELNGKAHALCTSADGEEMYWTSEFNACGMGGDRFELRVEQAGVCGPRNL